ncbi:nSTAND1 domain-containing NTPase [Nonomuraea rhodomycinica]|uniref:Helix-turn-helix domain-containing protein n=1 Tax=Nonomuraea rhodomycinica TaxID=1712872 RepID=A0A7Y6M9C7_9ACTN|nr:helix-turn-helix domain-containing protein [Nonomuraea rhodomycinica]NUW38630.1 helix-turn-helix domain-containing protein [Nonomuraea rhodomycinica]
MRRLRRERGLSLNELARRTHYTKGYLSKVETDDKALTPGVARGCDEALETGGQLAALVERVAGACPYRGLRPYEAEDSRWFFGRERALALLVSRLTERLRGEGPLAVVAPSGAGKSSLLRAGLLAAVRRGALPVPGSRSWPALLFTPGERPVAELLSRVAAVTGLDAAGLELALADGPDRLAEQVRAALDGRPVPDGGQGPSRGRGPGRGRVPDSGRGPDSIPVREGQAAPDGMPASDGRRVSDGMPASDGRQASDRRPVPVGRPVPDTRPVDTWPVETRLVMVVDQLEEVFTLCPDLAERHLFLDALHALSLRPPAADRRGTPSTSGTPEPPPALVVLGIRADFYGHCLAYPGLVDALRDGQLPLGPMTPAELREVVTGPARAAGLTLEPGLVELLLRDLGVPADTPGDGHGHGPLPEPGVLPLLSHALLVTWQRRRGDTLTVEDYRLTGGIGGAVAATAQRVHDGLDPHGQEIARRLFLQMVCVNEDNTETRRPVDPRRLPESHFPPEATAAVVEAFAGARLLTVDAGLAWPAHEALLRAWPALREWILAGRAGLRLRRQILEAAETWEREGRDPSLLYRGTRLQAAHDWAARAGAGASGCADTAPGAAEREFLEAGLALRDAEDAAARRRSRRLRHLAATLAVLLVLASSATVYAARTRAEATEQRDLALSQKVAGEAAGLREAAPSLAAQLSLAAYRLSATPESRSGLLTAFTAPYAARLTAGEGVNRALFSRDGRLLVTAGDDGVRLWDVTDPHRPAALSEFAGDGADVEAAALSADARRLVTAGLDGSVRVWDVGDPRRPVPVSGFAAHDRAAWSVALTADGSMAATVSDDGTARLWDLSDPRDPGPLATLTGHAGAVRGAALSPDGRTLATTGDDDTGHLWDVADPRRPRRLGTLTGHGEDVWAVTFSPDGTRIATGSDDRTGGLWDVSDPRHPHRLATLPGHSGPVIAAGFGPDGRTVATGGWDHEIRVWDVSDPRRPRPVSVLTGHSDTVGSVAFSPDGRTLASASWDHTARLWETGGPVARGHEGPVRAVAFHPGGRLLASGGDGRAVRLWDVADPYRPVARGVLDSPSGTTYALAFGRGGTVLAAAGEDETVRLWDVSDPAEPARLPTLTEHTARVRAVAFSPDGRMLAGAGFDNTVRLWDLTDPRRPAPLAAFDGRAGSLYAVAFSPDGRRLASAGFDGAVRLWDLADPRRPALAATLRGHRSTVHAVGFSPDGRLLASAGFDRTARLWDLTAPGRPRPLATLTGHRSGVSAVAFGRRGGLLATAGDDRTVRLWDLARPAAPRPLAVLTGHGDSVRAAAFGADGRTLATAGGDGTVRLWDPDPERVAARVCALAHPVITPSEWAEHFPGLALVPPC